MLNFVVFVVIVVFVLNGILELQVLSGAENISVYQILTFLFNALLLSLFKMPNQLYKVQLLLLYRWGNWVSEVQ